MGPVCSWAPLPGVAQGGQATARPLMPALCGPIA